MHASFFLISQFNLDARLKVQSICDFLSVRPFIEERKFKERGIRALVENFVKYIIIYDREKTSARIRYHCKE